MATVVSELKECIQEIEAGKFLHRSWMAGIDAHVRFDHHGAREAG